MKHGKGGGKMSYGMNRQPNPTYTLPHTKEAAMSKSYPIQNRANKQSKMVYKTKG